VSDDTERFDVVVVGGTPGGCAAAIAAERRGRSAVVLDRTDHVGGLPANGLGATDIATRGATGGLFGTFVDRVRDHYVETYGPDSSQVAACDDGYHFEPAAAERVFDDLLSEHGVTVRTGRRFVADEDGVAGTDGTVDAVRVTDRDRGAAERYAGRVFVDATYEGDLAVSFIAPNPESDRLV
jgi:flavin-dependent dehydrogenase